MQILARYRFLHPEDLPFLAAVVHYDLALPVDTHQVLVVLPLHALFADHIPLLVVDELGGVQLRFTDLADVADDVRGEAFLWVQPLLGVDELHLRERARVAIRFEE